MVFLKKVGLIFLMLLLLSPSAVQFAHVFSGHDHMGCNHYAERHFHQKNLDCDILQFHQFAFPTLELSEVVFLIPTSPIQKPLSSYSFISEFQALSYALRGPPQMI